MSGPSRADADTARAERPRRAPARTVTAPDDAVERAASARADQALSGATCTACAIGLPCRSPSCASARATPEPAARAWVPPTGGAPLPPTVRREFAPRFAADLDAVRVHDHPAAHEAAAALTAQAFTVGHDLVFAAGQFAPATAAGRALLAHELAHVEQGGGGPIRRQVAPVEVDPCAVDVGALTNSALVAERRRAEAYVRANPRTNDFYAYRFLLQACQTEFVRRIRLGDAWLADAMSGVPDRLFVVRDSVFDGLEVSAADAALATGASAARDAPIMTSGQVTSLARANGASNAAISSALDQAATRAALILPRLTAPSTGATDPLALFSPFGPDPTRTFGILEAYRHAANPGIGTVGALGEFTFRHTDPLRAGPYVDLNTLTSTRNFPNYDWLGAESRVLVQVKTSTVAPDRSWGSLSNGSSLSSGHNEITGAPFGDARHRNKFVDALTRMSTAGHTFTEAQALAAGYLAVNSDHVEPTRTRVRDLVGANPESFTNVFDALLRRAPSRGYATWAAVEAGPAADRALVITELTERMAARVISHGLSTAEVVRLSATRSTLNVLSNDDFVARLSPEVIEAEMLGGTRAALSAAARRSIATGAPIAVGMSLLTESIGALSGRDFDLARVGRQSVLGTLGTSATSVAEYGAALWAGQRTSTWLTAGRARAGAGAASTLLLAPLLTSAEMAFSRDSFAWQDYVARSSRATVAGLAGWGAMAAWGAYAGAGTALGARLGPWGAVAGLAIGTAVYFAVDYAAGPSVENLSRRATGEPRGCPR